MAQAYKQDLPPRGGYEKISYERIFHKPRFSGVQVIVGMSAFILFGWYRAIHGSREKTREVKERNFGKLHLLPLLQAEEDRRTLRGMLEFERQEALIMKDVPGWEVGKKVFHTKKWIPPLPVQLRDPPKDYMRVDD